MIANTVLINNIEYYIIDRLIFNNNAYYILSNCSDKKDILIQKELIENNQPFLVNIDSEQEFNNFFKYYKEKTSQ